MAVSRMKRWAYVAGAAALTSVFWWSGLTKLWNFPDTLAEMAHFGLNPPALFALGTIGLQLAASALIVFSARYAWIGAGALAAFTLATIPLAHHFWTMSGQEAFLERTIAQEHLAVVGGLILAAAGGHE